MMKEKKLFIMMSFIKLIGCTSVQPNFSYEPVQESFMMITFKERPIDEDVSINLEQYNRTPNEWGEFVTGVKTKIKTDKKKIALTFDACGGDFGSQYDADLISFLRSEQVPATLFLNERWIKANETLFFELASDSLFQIENHGTNHLLSTEDR